MQSQPRFRFFAAAMVVLALFGAAHLVGHLSGPSTPASDDEGTLLRLMTTLRTPPTNRSLMELVQGFSLFVTLAPWALAAVGLALRPLARADPRAMRRVVLIYAAALGAFTAVSVAYWFAAPTSFLAAACVLAACSWFFDGRTPRPTA